VTKKFFIQLCILIAGKNSPSSENIGVFIELVLEELQLLWIVSDYPALGLVSGLLTHGYKACVVCGLETDSCSAKTCNNLMRIRMSGIKDNLCGGKALDTLPSPMP
jgi:uncharacterized ferredoxin-like protein